MPDCRISMEQARLGVQRLHHHSSGHHLSANFVYLLLVNANGAALLKFGTTANPTTAARRIIRGSPYDPISLAYTALPGPERARDALHALAVSFATWAADRPGWYRFAVDEKLIFNATLRLSLEHLNSPSWPITWKKVNLYAKAQAENNLQRTPPSKTACSG